MNVLDAAAVFAAGVAAGGINAVVGSGSLITFPTLVALGFPPVVANVSNNIGLVPGNVTGAYGYRHELKGQRARLLRLGSASLLGAVSGALLLLGLPAGAFKVIVPALIMIALVLVIVQPRLQAWLPDRSEQDRPAHGGPWLWLGVLAAGVYGGYFGAAQGIVLIAMLGIALSDDLQRVNAAKNVLSAIVNGTAALVFILLWAFSDVRINWWAVLLIATGSTVGGLFGAKVGRRIPPPVLRGVIVVVGLVAIVNLLV
ncbi:MULTISPECIES: sulfite exporter TauE/SafE family protein [Thermomonosporaceae]|uniref:sulfite exporter TauE/SafE family protein n=1 Tax=Thermomonosporaceae TaxID=2012 RepID=UPI00255AC2A8|nr:MULTISPECIES: sulfite exporter TauE/SafE family protein [Thermomonosporaceae]MDL4773329.1 sulfite exporter TauE/SafE family protein [Actinomadura xylanilytica]